MVRIPCASFLFSWTSQHQMELDHGKSLLFSDWKKYHKCGKCDISKIQSNLTVGKFTSVTFSGSNSVKRNETVTCRNILNMVFLDPFQIEKASKTGCHILIMVDANLCTNKWDDAKFLYKNYTQRSSGTKWNHSQKCRQHIYGGSYAKKWLHSRKRHWPCLLKSFHHKFDNNQNSKQRFVGSAKAPWSWG